MKIFFQIIFNKKKYKINKIYQFYMKEKIRMNQQNKNTFRILYKIKIYRKIFIFKMEVDSFHLSHNVLTFLIILHNLF